MRCEPRPFGLPSNPDARGRAVVLCALISRAPLLSLPATAQPMPYCDPSTASCLVTAEIFVDRPPYRQEVPLASSIVEVDGSPVWTDDEGLLMASCDPSVFCEAKLDRPGLTVRDQCAATAAGTPASAFSLSGNRPTYTCGTDCTTTDHVESTGNTWAARTAYYWADQARRKAQRHVDEEDIPTVRVETNHDAETHASGAHLVCAGFWNESTSTIELFKSGGGCANTGENASIVAHEWGHALYDALYDPLASRPIDATTDEAQADVHAALVTGDVCIGRGVRPGERCAGCREDCNGLRDLGAFGLSSPSPVTAATIFDPGGLDCPDGDGPLGAAPHCESLIASTAFMDMAAMLRSRYGEEAGVVIAEGLFYDALPLLTSVYQVVSGTTDGCHAGSWYNALLEADDARNGDGDLTNGTPHGCLIFQAFDAHDVACEVPLTGCPPWVGAGPDKETCVGSPVSIGPPAQQALDVSWSHGAEGSPISVTPQDVGLVTYTMQASDSSGAVSWQDTVDVRAYGCNGYVFENFDAGALATWEMTGLWHLVTAGCPANYPPPFMYFGLDACHYDTCRGAARGDLTSDVITVSAPAPGFVPALTFVSQRGVEGHAGPITTDHTEVWIEEWPAKPGSWADLRWARSSASSQPLCLPDAPPPSVARRRAPGRRRRPSSRFPWDPTLASRSGCDSTSTRSTRRTTITPAG